VGGDSCSLMVIHFEAPPLPQMSSSSSGFGTGDAHENSCRARFRFRIFFLHRGGILDKVTTGSKVEVLDPVDLQSSKRERVGDGDSIESDGMKGGEGIEEAATDILIRRSRLFLTESDFLEREDFESRNRTLPILNRDIE